MVWIWPRFNAICQEKLCVYEDARVTRSRLAGNLATLRQMRGKTQSEEGENSARLAISWRRWIAKNTRLNLCFQLAHQTNNTFLHQSLQWSWCVCWDTGSMRGRHPPPITIEPSQHHEQKADIRSESEKSMVRSGNKMVNDVVIDYVM
mmetsp:Transcript_52425/g.162705  ORF Transcript_52425/g.162705 Transcript_52425/m.162705 type:complete len:148 (-) Transcript_52425:117-560(-)